MTSSTVVYLGPSLALSEAQSLLPAQYLPPICRGDLARLDLAATRRVAIVDGEFFQSLAVSPKEVLRLLDAGVAVYGASSMGALRAAELAREGMTGIGRVFSLFHRRRLFADDEVAVAYCRETNRTSSEPLVNLRLNLWRAHRSGVLTAAQSARLIRRLRDTYFPERTFPLLHRFAAAEFGPSVAAALQAHLSAHAIDQKADDARALLRVLAADILETT